VEQDDRRPPGGWIPGLHDVKPHAAYGDEQIALSDLGAEQRDAHREHGDK
jgi:hypothetical protein